MAAKERFNRPGPSQQKDFPYFRPVWNNVIAALLAASFIPLILIGGGMYYYATYTLKEKTLASLRMDVNDNKRVIDQFLAERTMSLKLISANLDLHTLTRPGRLKLVFQYLQEELPCFTDLGIIDHEGKHLAYVGPYNLISKNYKDSAWFKSVMEKGVFISNVFLGFRKLPHFIIAVKQAGESGPWILRATVDTTYFNTVVSKVNGEKSGNAFLVNGEGIFQTVPLVNGRIMGQSGLGDLKTFEGIKLEELEGQIRATTWLKNVPWLFVVQIDRDKFFAALHRVLNIGLFVFLLGGILIVMTVLLTTNQLVLRLEDKRRSIQVLDQQLRRTSYLASSMELSYGFFREIKDALANIDIASKWLQHLISEGRVKETEESLDQIKSEASRSRNLVDRFVGFIRPGDPIIKEININEILDDLLEFLKSELHFKNIRVKLDYQDPLPFIRSDRSKLRQVFQNIVMNAISAVEEDGDINIVTSAGKETVTVSVSDNGPGIPEEYMGKIFDPLFTTKEKGTGLGLSITTNILEKLGGNISVKSEPARGASFIVELPFHLHPPGKQQLQNTH